MTSERVERRRRAHERGGTWTFLGDARYLAPYVRRYWRLAAGSASLIGAGALVSLVTPWPLAIILDTVLGNKPLPAILGPLLDGSGRYALLVFAVVFSVVVTAFQYLVSVLENFVNTKLEQRLILDFRSDLFQHVQRLSLTFHDETKTGTLMFKLSNEADAAGTIVVAVPPLVQAFLTIVLMFAIAFRIDATLALIAMAVVPFVYWSAGYYARKIQPRLIEVRNLEGQTLSILYEAMAMLRVVVAFGRQRHEYRRFREQGEEAVAARVGLTVRQTLFALFVKTITASGYAAVLGVGAYHVLQHRITAGELMVMLGYATAIFQPLEQISSTLSSLQQYFVGLRYALDLLDTEPDVKEKPGARRLESAIGRVSFEGVDFAYPGRKHTLSEITFEAKPGQQVAIVGPTGAGKTTLVSLLMRFYDPDAGAILFDGVDVRDLTLHSLREQVGVVLQEPLLFSGSIRENILYGRLDATGDEVVEAARAANAHEFVERLPSGYETVIGERGAQLSGGEKQRLCIARAFLRDAPILVLDEPTSSVDSRTESIILDALDRLMEDRTSFMIAHRLSTVRHADLIVVLNDGRIVEQGTHEQLLARRGLYAQLWLIQIGQARRAARRGRVSSFVGQDLQSAAALALAAAIAADVRTRSTDAIRTLSTQRDHPSEAVRLAAGLTDALPDDLAGLEEIWHDLALDEQGEGWPEPAADAIANGRGA